MDYDISTGFVAKQFGVTQHRVQQLAKHYRKIGELPVLFRPGRNPSDNHENLRDEVLWGKRKPRCGAMGIAAYLRMKDGIMVDNNLVHRIILEGSLAVEGPERR